MKLVNQAVKNGGSTGYTALEFELPATTMKGSLCFHDLFCRDADMWWIGRKQMPGVAGDKKIIVGFYHLSKSTLLRRKNWTSFCSKWLVVIANERNHREQVRMKTCKFVELPLLLGWQKTITSSRPSKVTSTWRIISVSKQLGSPPFIRHEVRPFGRETTRSLGDENDHHGY